MSSKVYGPCSEKQRIFLTDTTTDVILLGGGAGGGKSFTCLTKNLDGVDDPHFRCTIFRRTYPELKRQGGLIDESKTVYRDFKGIYKTQAMQWIFPSGAQVSFSAIASDDDLGSWQGSQLVRALIDEAADKWTEKQVLFLLSRIRSAHSKIHPQLILTANPDIDSFLATWVAFCLDPVTGVPVPGTEDKVRWFIVIDNKAHWADTPEECYELYGRPRGQIFAHGLTEEELNNFSPEEKLKLCMPKSFRFIPTGVFDNPYLLPPRNTSYLANLLAQPYVNQLKYLHGSWTAKETGSGYFKREWCKIVDAPPEKAKRVRSWDFAASEISIANPNPDATAGVLMSRSNVGAYYIEDVIKFCARTDKVLSTVIETGKKDGVDEVQVTIPKDPGAAGATANSFYIRTLAENGIAAKSIPISGHAGKLTRFKPFCSLAESGSVYVVRGDWNEDFFTELENFEGIRNQKDDQVDATSDAFNTLSKQLQLPTIAVPALEMTSVIPKIQ